MPKNVTHTCNKEAEIASMQTALGLLEPNIEKIININMSSIRAMIEAKHDLEMLEFKSVKEKQDRTNGRVEQLEVIQKGYDKLAGELISDIKPIRWIKQHPIKAIGVALLVCFALIYVADSLSIETIISWIK